MSSTLKSTGGSVAATVLVFVSSACCVGPLAVVLSFVGLSSGTVLLLENTFGPYRPYVMALTALALGIGFYDAYRQDRSCEPEKLCNVPASRRVQRVLLWFATTLLVVLSYYTYVHPNLDLYFGVYL